MSHAAIILAAGYGSLRGPSGGPRPKLLEHVGDTSMIVRVVRTALDSGLSPCILVLNPIYGPGIWHIVRKGLRGRTKLLRHTIQEASYGSGHAAFLGAYCAQQLNCEHATVLYGDMPLWKPTTVRALADLHRLGTAPMTMATYRYAPPEADWFQRFARVIHKESRVVGVVEARDLLPYQLSGLTCVNPALMSFRIDWMLRTLPNLVPHDQKNGYPAETYLPELVQLACTDGGVTEFPLSDPVELLGINNLQELERAREQLAKRDS